MDVAGVVVVWQVRTTMWRPRACVLVRFPIPNVSTRHNRVAKRAQHVAPNIVTICCVEMLRPFGRRSLQMLGQRCWDMLWRDVAIVWLRLKVLLWSNNSLLFFLQILKACFLDTSLAKSWASNFIQRLFSLSASLGFHGPPLFTFKTDRLDFRGLDRG